MLVPDITIYDALKGMLGEEKARQVVAGIKEQVVQEIEVQKNVLATKEDIASIKEAIGKLDTKISESKAEMMKWMFGVFAMTMLAIIGLYFKH
jgi:hypothetical protein